MRTPQMQVKLRTVLDAWSNFLVFYTTYLLAPVPLIFTISMQLPFGGLPFNVPPSQVECYDMPNLITTPLCEAIYLPSSVREHGLL